MSINIFKRIRKFFFTTIIGGLAAVLPLALLIVVFRWIISLIEKYIGPLVRLVNTHSTIQEFLLYVVAIIAILSAFFLAGLIIQTRVGKFFNVVLEKKYLMKIPGYKVARETVMQFFGKNRSFFSEVVLVDIFNSGTLMTGFITDVHNDFVTVFVPTGPNPTSGNIYHVKKDKIIHSRTPVDTGMKTIISCGAGSNEIFKNQTLSSDQQQTND